MYGQNNYVLDIFTLSIVFPTDSILINCSHPPPSAPTATANTRWMRRIVAARATYSADEKIEPQTIRRRGRGKVLHTNKWGQQSSAQRATSSLAATPRRALPPGVRCGGLPGRRPAAFGSRLWHIHRDKSTQSP